MENEIKEGKVKIKYEGHKLNFIVFHNLPDVHGLSFEAAVTNWLFRTDKFTAQSLCDYINGKKIDLHCGLTKEDVEKLIQMDA